MEVFMVQQDAHTACGASESVERVFGADPVKLTAASTHGRLAVHFNTEQDGGITLQL